MKMIYEWICSLISYMILMTMITNLLPDHKYEKYLRLFSGVVFLLLVISPFTNLTGTAAQMAAAFEQIAFQTDVEAMKQEIANVDRERLERLTEEYERAAQENLQNETGGNYGVEEGNVAVIPEAE